VLVLVPIAAAPSAVDVGAEFADLFAQVVDALPLLVILIQIVLPGVTEIQELLA
jgi:hypothetical protein